MILKRAYGDLHLGNQQGRSLRARQQMGGIRNMLDDVYVAYQNRHVHILACTVSEEEGSNIHWRMDK